MHRRQFSRKHAHPSGARQRRSANRRGTQIITYDYRDENGALLYQVVRREPGRRGAAKTFYQRHRKEDGGWAPRLHGVSLVPYRLPELLRAPRTDWVFIVEGEKDADRLAALDFTATCNVGGAGMWRDEYQEFFRDRRVTILPDNDLPGWKHAQHVARSLAEAAHRVKILELPCIGPKEDVSNWLDIGGTKVELLQLARQARRWTDSSSLNSDPNQR